MSRGFRFLWLGFLFNLVMVLFKNIWMEFMPEDEGMLLLAVDIIELDLSNSATRVGEPVYTNDDF